jgi:hypothetical protein
MSRSLKGSFQDLLNKKFVADMASLIPRGCGLQRRATPLPKA